VIVKRFLTALVCVNACAWPGVFGAYAVISGDHYRVLGYVAAGAVFGGVVLLCLAALLAWLESRALGRRVAEEAPGSPPPARKVAVGALIIIALGAVGLVCESLRYKPPHEQSGGTTTKQAGGPGWVGPSDELGG
jgi:hypothetical protein